MSKRISKKLREEAAALCAGMASTPAAYIAWHANEWQSTLAASNAAVKLADAAFWCVEAVMQIYTLNLGVSAQLEAYAEAEALLRTGWSPR